jgi:hypothetical protein
MSAVKEHLCESVDSLSYPTPVFDSASNMMEIFVCSYVQMCEIVVG